MDEYSLGCLKDPKDRRDYPARMRLPQEAPIFPISWSWRSALSPVKDQMGLGACVGFACAALKEFQEIQQRIWTPFKDSSEMFIYWGAKEIDQWPGQEGTSIRSALKVLAQRGVPTEAGWSYVPAAAPGHRPPTKPKWWSYGVARWAKIGHYYRLASVDEIKEWLYLRGPIVAGVGVGATAFKPVEHMGCPGKSYVAIPESVLGGHAILLVSYNDAFKLVGFKNSWGTGWGNLGFGYLSYEYLGLLGFDFWAVMDR